MLIITTGIFGTMAKISGFVDMLRAYVPGKNIPMETVRNGFSSF
jgi:hypothetical protein